MTHEACIDLLSVTPYYGLTSTYDFDALPFAFLMNTAGFYELLIVYFFYTNHTVAKLMYANKNSIDEVNKYYRVVIFYTFDIFMLVLLLRSHTYTHIFSETYKCFVKIMNNYCHAKQQQNVEFQ